MHAIKFHLNPLNNTAAKNMENGKPQLAFKENRSFVCAFTHRGMHTWMQMI